MSIDKDIGYLKTVLALEEPVKALLAVFEAAKPAIERLEKVNYPGAEVVADAVQFTIEGDCSGGLTRVIEALDMFQAGNGSVAAYDFEFYAKQYEQTSDEAARDMIQILGTDAEALDRIKAMREYAATVAS